MNKKQIVAMWVGIIVFVIITINTNNRVYLGLRPTTQCEIDYITLPARLLCTAIVTAAAIYTLKDKK